MKILDFSRSVFDELNPEIHWEKEILEFWQEWNSNSEFIQAKTSGSTGVPKSIQLPKEAMRMSAQLTGEFFKLKRGNSSLLALPVGFIAGKMMLVRAIELGLKLYCIEPKSHLDLSEFSNLDFVPLTPMQVEKSFGSLEKIDKLLIGGAPLSDTLRARLKTISTHSFESYGMTETITHIGLKEISESGFKVLKGVGIRKDERGCLVIQTPYFEEEIITNDLVEIINSYEFKWLGRLDNVINSGGIKLIPEQIEEKLKPFIASDFIITSKPDETLGEKLILVVETQEELVLNWQETGLSKYQTPKEIIYLKEFPRTESGKVKRKEISTLV